MRRSKNLALAPDEARWVEFRLADTSWRAQAATETADTTKFELAQKQLEELIRTNDKDDDRDLVWAEAHESLGDFFWTRRNQMNWGVAWPHYQQALDWWAGQREIERARDRYLKIVFKAAEPPRPERVLLLHLLRQLHSARHSRKRAEDQPQRKRPGAPAFSDRDDHALHRRRLGDAPTRARRNLKPRSKPASKLTGTTTRSSITPSG